MNDLIQKNRGNKLINIPVETNFPYENRWKNDVI